MQALQAKPIFTGGAARRESRGSMPVHRDIGGGARSSAIGEPRGTQYVSLPPCVQSDHRIDAKGIRGSASRQACAEEAWQERHGDGGYLRRRVQLEWKILRNIQ